MGTDSLHMTLIRQQERNNLELASNLKKDVAFYKELQQEAKKAKELYQRDRKRFITSQKMYCLLVAFYALAFAYLSYILFNLSK
jgi:hypothetical protein